MKTITMKIFYSLLLFLSIDCKSQNIENLLYCNENRDVTEIYLMSKNNFIAHSIINGSNYLHLYNQENLISDTLFIGRLKDNMLQDLIVMGSEYFFFRTLTYWKIIKVSNHKLVTNKTGVVQNIDKNGILMYTDGNIRVFFQPTDGNSKKTLAIKSIMN